MFKKKRKRKRNRIHYSVIYEDRFIHSFSFKGIHTLSYMYVCSSYKVFSFHGFFIVIENEKEKKNKKNRHKTPRRRAPAGEWGGFFAKGAGKIPWQERKVG